MSHHPGVEIDLAACFTVGPSEAASAFGSAFLLAVASRRKTTRQTTHHRAHHLDGFPDQVTIVRSRHPFEGSALNVLGWCHRRGELHLTLVLPDGTRALVPAAWTDLPIAQHLPRASPQCARAAFLASHAELLHARTIVDALLRQLDAAHTVLPPQSEDSHATAKLSRPTTSARGRTRMGSPR